MIRQLKLVLNCCALFHLADLRIDIFNDKCCKIRCSNADNMVGLDGSTFNSQSGGDEAAEHLNASEWIIN